MANINELRNKLLQEAQPNKRALPFKRLEVNHSDQLFFMRDAENRKELGKEATILVLGEYAQYTFFDQKLERTTVLSQIVKPSLIKKAIDLKSGKPISFIIERLKSQGLKPVYNSIIIALVKTENGYEEALFYMKGAVLQSWMEIVKSLQTSYIASELRLSLKPNKKGAVKYSTLSLVDILPCENEALLAKGVMFLDRFKEALKSYNSFEPEPEPEEEDLAIEF